MTLLDSYNKALRLGEEEQKKFIEKWEALIVEVDDKIKLGISAFWNGRLMLIKYEEKHLLFPHFIYMEHPPGDPSIRKYFTLANWEKLLSKNHIGPEEWELKTPAKCVMKEEGLWQCTEKGTLLLK